MQAIVVSKFGDEKELVLQTISIPKPGKNQALVKVHASGINPVDVIFRNGYLGPFNPKLPFTVGMDVAGIVEEVGESSRWKKGDRVFGTMKIGGYAQFAVCDDQNLLPLPQNITFEQGAGIFVPYFTAHVAISDAKVKKEDVVLVHGASGSVGTSAVQILKRHGIKEIWGTAGSEEGLQFLLKQGCTQAFNHRKEGYIEEITKLGGCDVILEMAAQSNLNKDFQSIKDFGRIIVIGGNGDGNFPIVSLMSKRVQLIGMALLKGTPSEYGEAGKDIVEGLVNGSYVPIVGKTYSLKDASQAHHDLSHSSTTKGKLVLLPWN